MRDFLELLTPATRVPGTDPIVAAVLREFAAGLQRPADEAPPAPAPTSYHGDPCRTPTPTS